jgi:hypothetical protein
MVEHYSHNVEDEVHRFSNGDSFKARIICRLSSPIYGTDPAFAFSFGIIPVCGDTNRGSGMEGKTQSGKHLWAITAPVAGITLFGSGGGNTPNWAQTDPFKQEALFPP